MTFSKYFTLKEATKSQTAIRKGIDNTPNQKQLERMEYVATTVLDKVREFIDAPLGISSFFRCEALNSAIGGSYTSQHCKGEAVDIDCDIYGYGYNDIVFEWIKDNIDFDQLIWEFGDDEQPAWIHVSKKPLDNRGQILRAIRVDGKTSYVKFA